MSNLDTYRNRILSELSASRSRFARLSEFGAVTESARQALAALEASADPALHALETFETETASARSALSKLEALQGKSLIKRALDAAVQPATRALDDLNSITSALPPGQRAIGK